VNILRQFIWVFITNLLVSCVDEDIYTLTQKFKGNENPFFIQRFPADNGK